MQGSGGPRESEPGLAIWFPASSFQTALCSSREYESLFIQLNSSHFSGREFPHQEFTDGVRHFLPTLRTAYLDAPVKLRWDVNCQPPHIPRFREHDLVWLSIAQRQHGFPSALPKYTYFRFLRPDVAARPATTVKDSRSRSRKPQPVAAPTAFHLK
jgi:hypothetical protein